MLTKKESLENKAVVVTGGTTGIGRAGAIKLAKKGARVLIFGRHNRELSDALEAIKRSGGQATGLTADTASYNDVKRVFAKADRELGGLDILINNAAVGAGSVVESDYKTWQYQVNVNLVGYISCAHEAFARLQKSGGGHIVNIGSLSAEVKDPESDIYAATKSGIRGFTASFRKKVNQWGIRVTLIEPGLVGTDLPAIPPRQQREMEAAEEMLMANDVAEAILFALARPHRSEVITIQLRPHKQSNI
ncbi:MAG: SDR family oxidoreductase [Patescibacteria group bacterium]